MNRAVEFFSRQFERQIAAADYQLNPFEQMALPHLRGRVLDLGCGLGNFALAAARLGHEVTALDACPQATADLQRRASAERLPLRAHACDLSRWAATTDHDTVVAIGLLMFFSCEEADAILTEMQRATAPAGTVIVNVLIRGTTFMDMFDPERHCLFDPDELLSRFAEWNVLEHRIQDFPAAHSKIKRFSTIIAERPRTSV
jgi:tellurite methyltransferase